MNNVLLSFIITALGIATVILIFYITIFFNWFIFVAGGIILFVLIWIIVYTILEHG